MQILIPQGWEAEDHWVYPPPPLEFLTLIEPPEPYGWLPKFLRERLRSDPEYRASITIVQGTRGFEHRWGYKTICKEELDSQTGPRYHTARRGVNVGVGYGVTFHHSNRRQFEATFRQICESFQVIRQP